MSERHSINAVGLVRVRPVSVAIAIGKKLMKTAKTRRAGETDAEPDDEERREGHLRNELRRNDVRKDHLAGDARRREQQGHANTEQCRNRAREHGLATGKKHLVTELAGIDRERDANLRG